MKPIASRLLAPASLALVVAFLNTGCINSGDASLPIKVEWYRISTSSPADTTLIILLPGIQNHSSAFESKGVVAMVSPEAGIDLVTANAHMGYFEARNLDVRLREDVILPARERGYRHIEIAGVSLGGLGGLLYATHYPADIERVTALSPYVGKDEIIEEVRSAGGIQSWKPGREDLANDSRDLLLWRNLVDLDYRNRPTSFPVVKIGVGASDRFVAANKYFCKEVLNTEPLVVPGGHTWSTWRTLFQKLVLDNR